MQPWLIFVTFSRWKWYCINNLCVNLTWASLEDWLSGLISFLLLAKTAKVWVLPWLRCFHAFPQHWLDFFVRLENNRVRCHLLFLNLCYQSLCCHTICILRDIWLEGQKIPNVKQRLWRNIKKDMIWLYYFFLPIFLHHL